MRGPDDVDRVVVDEGNEIARAERDEWRREVGSQSEVERGYYDDMDSR